MKQLVCKLLIGFLLIAWGCTEPYEIEEETFEDALVIEATITNELKHQTIKLSRTYRLEESGPTFESGADVAIEDDLGNIYPFMQQANVYMSENPFQAQPGRSYKIRIATSDGKHYYSLAENLTPVSELENVTTIVGEKDGVMGVNIVANSFDATGQSRYYRYEFEETYKIVVPNPTNLEAIYTGDNEEGYPLYAIVERTEEAHTCFTTNKSVDIVQTTTAELGEDRVVNFPLRFISVDSPMLRERYSILVRQYVQSLDAYIFYKNLAELSDSDNILSQRQPGFFAGNMRCEENPNEKVVGFFEVASVSQKRIYLEFDDIFPDAFLPDYWYECHTYNYDSTDYYSPPREANQLLVKLLAVVDPLVFLYNTGSVFTMITGQCGDCRIFSSNVRPDFWED